MTNYDRGFDPPPDDRVFDAADDSEEEEGSRLPLLIIIALVVLAAFAGVVWLAYSQGVERGRSDAGGAVAQRETGGAPPSGGQDTIKPYEQPAPADEDGDTAPSMPVTADEEAAQAAPSPGETPMQIPAPAASRPVGGVAALPPATKPAEAASAAAKPIAPPTPTEMAAAKPETAPAAVPSAGAESAGAGFALQIGAYKSQAEADAAWAAYKAKHTTLVSSYSSNTVKVDLGAKGTWYRLRIGPFQSREDAIALCDKLKTEGGSCFLAK